MMPVVRLSDTTWERMKKHARPLEDTPDDIVRRALDALEGKVSEKAKPVRVGRPPRAAGRSRTPQKHFREPLLITLDKLGGSASLPEVQRAMYPIVKEILLPADREAVSNGDARWWNATCWERSDLVKEGYLKGNSPRGVWELSELGQAEVEAIKTRD